MDRPLIVGAVPFGSHPTSATLSAGDSPVRGLYTDGNPAGGILATIDDPYVMNMLIEEMRNVVVASGLTPSDADWTQLLAALRLLFVGRMTGVQGFGSPGTFTYTPTDGTKFAILRMQGGGGAGGGAVATGAGQYSVGGGGGSGAWCYKRINTPAAVSIVIGAAGASVSGSSGGNGGSSSYGGLYTAAGGFGGKAGGPSSGGFLVNPGGGGSVGGTGDIEAGGNPGVSGLQSGINVIGGNGGASTMFSGAGFGSSGLAGGPALSPGCGGGGASRGPSLGAVAGGNGGQGYILIEEYA